MRYEPGSVEGRLMAGDPDALGEVIRWIASTLTTSRFRQLRADWPDLHQEILLRVVESLRLGRFDLSRDFRSYVQAIARYTALRSLSIRRRHRSVDASDPSWLKSDGPEAERTVIAGDVATRVLRASSPECQSLIVDYFVEQKDYAQIATERGIPVGTVKSRLFRCLRNAHQQIQDSRNRRP